MCDGWNASVGGKKVIRLGKAITPRTRTIIGIGSLAKLKARLEIGGDNKQLGDDVVHVSHSHSASGNRNDTFPRDFPDKEYILFI